MAIWMAEKQGTSEDINKFYSQGTGKATAAMPGATGPEVCGEAEGNEAIRKK